MSVECKLTKSNALLKADLQEQQLKLEIIIQESRKMYDLRSVGKESLSYTKESYEIALSVNDEKMF